MIGVNRPRRGHIYRATGATLLLPLYASMAWKIGAFTSVVYHRRRTIDRDVKTLLYLSLSLSAGLKKILSSAKKKAAKNTGI